MSAPEPLNLETLDGSRIKDFQKLMRFKVPDILVVASPYDQYHFEVDGRLYELSQAENDQTLFAVGSTYSQENDTVYDGLSRQGRRVVTLAPILKPDGTTTP
jgi:hypothetical protein